MVLLDKINSDLKSAMKAGDAVLVSVLRLLLSAVNYKKIDKGSDLNEEELLDVVDKEVKKRKESIIAFTGKRDDLVEKEQAEMDILLTYLPTALSIAEIEQVVNEVVSKFGDGVNLGQIMGIVMGKLKGKRADGNLVRKLVEERINN